MKRKVAVGYIRVSTEEQTLNFSLQYQEENIRKYCDTNNLYLKKIYNEGFGSGGGIEERDEFRKMMRETLPDEEVDYVVVLADHRFARNHSDAVNLVDRLRDEGKNLICIADNINTENPSDHEYFRFKSIFSERQRLEIAFNCMYGMRQRAENGLYTGGKVTGYCSHNGELKVHPEQEIIVKDIFEKCASFNWGYKKIAKYLNRIGYKTVNNEEFDQNAVKTILSNPIYIGFIRFEEKIYNGKHDPILSMDVWEKAQKNMKQRSYMPVKIHPGSYFLAGLLKCPQCNSSMVHHKSSGGKYQYYQCLNNKNGKTCSSNLVQKAYAEEYVLSSISSIVKSPSIYKIVFKMVKSQIIMEQNTIQKSISQIQKDIEKIDKNILKTYEAFYKSNIEIHLKQINRLDTEKQFLNERLIQAKAVQSTKRDINVQDLVDSLMKNFEILFYSLDISKKKEFLQTIIHSIHILPGKSPKYRKIKEITYHVTEEEIVSLIIV